MAPKATFLEKISGLPQKPLKVLFVLPEVAPYAKVGGISQVGASLSKELKDLGVDVKIFMPKYGFIDQEEFPLEKVIEGLSVPTEDEENPELSCNVRSHTSEEGIETFFLENMEYYELRSNVYGYHDDPIRFALLSRGCLEYLKEHCEWCPDVIHANDWQTGYVPNYLKTAYRKNPKLKEIAALFTIHNLNYQGMFDHRRMSEMDFDDGKSPIAPLFDERLRKQNFLKRGILYADIVNTVSETYAKEILTEEYGEGLDKLLLELRGKLFGVVNGIDYETWDPSSDPLIPTNFNAASLGKRVENKIALQREFDLERGAQKFVMAVVARLVEQKGGDLLAESIPPFLAMYPEAQLVVVGSGEEKYMLMVEDLKKRYPQRVGLHLMPNFTLPHLVYAGADVFLAPSKFEPAGLTQLEAMRYGCVPVGRATGGIADTVEDFDFQSGTGTGFLFEEFDMWQLFASLVRAYEIYHHPSVWKNLQERCMKKDFSWKSSAQKYLELYRKAIVLHKGEK